MPDLFDAAMDADVRRSAPLADRMRPQSWEEFAGQAQIVGSGRLLRSAIESDELPSMIFWGPPGTGKTTLALLIAKLTKSHFEPFSAVTAGVKELRTLVAAAQERRKLHATRTILFIDEIHRWNKAQQDALLPHVERGVVTLIGATTENPSFEVNSALLSRCRVFVLEPLTTGDLESIIRRSLADAIRGLGSRRVVMDDTAVKFLATVANGDARTALNALELAVGATKPGRGATITVTPEVVKQALQKTQLLYDAAGEQHYNIISALHKSVRGGNVDAALYWLGRMLEAGEDPLYVARRLVRMAVEDIGLADPQALPQAVAAYQASHFMGMPECDVVLAQCVAYLAQAPKSVDVYQAYSAVKEDVKTTVAEPVPLHLRNAPTGLMKELGYGKGYQYSPDFEWKEDQEYLPPSLKGRKYLSHDKPQPRSVSSCQNPIHPL